MATFRLRHFSRPEILRATAPDRLLRFLEPYARWLIERGVPLPSAGSGRLPDYEGLAGAFMSPDCRMPQGLIDALYVVDEMATEEGMDALLAEAQRLGLPLAPGQDHSPADVAVQVWLLDRDVLERKHAEQLLTKARSYESYQAARSPAPPFKAPSALQLRLLERALDDAFEGKKRGRGARVLVYERGDEVWFQVRHGEPFKREESLEGADPSSVCFRPSKRDVLTYHAAIGELRINARSKWEKDLYRAKFGEHLFGAEDLFPGTQKYTLEPLRTLGEEALRCEDVEGIDWVRLTEVQLFYGGTPWELVSRKSDDVFALLRSREWPFPESGRLIRATFQVKFSDAKSPRSVVVRPPNVAQFTRDDDSAFVEAWLGARGFIIRQESEDGDPADPVLASR
jgi:hypothetical protein